MTIVLHSHPLSSYCWKVLIALYENGAPFDLRMVNLGDQDARTAYAKLWPTAKIPLMEDGGQVIPETSIQIEHLDSHHRGRVALLPDDPQARMQVRLWDRVFDNYVMDPMGRFIAQQLRPEAERDQRTLDASLAELTRAYDMIEDRLDPRPWAVGEGFTMADCAAAPSLFYAAIVQPFSPRHAKLSAYFERLMDRPSVRRAIAEAGPFFQYYPLRDRLPARFLGEAENAG